MQATADRIELEHGGRRTAAAKLSRAEVVSVIEALQVELVEALEEGEPVNVRPLGVLETLDRPVAGKRKRQLFVTPKLTLSRRLKRRVREELDLWARELAEEARDAG